MGKKKAKKPANSLVSEDVFNALQACRPIRLFFAKQKKKGDDTNLFTLRTKFAQLSPEKKLKYYQKAVDKYIRVLDDKDVNERVQMDAQLFENLLTKREQGIYFQSLEAPTKPLHSAAAYYSDAKKQERDTRAKAWKDLSNDEKKPYIQKFNDAKAEYSAQVRSFADNLPERLKPEYLAYLNPVSHSNETEDEKSSPAPISQRRKSAQSLPENFKHNLNDHPQKLARAELDELHKCKPGILYYEKKVPEDERPTFSNTLQKLAHIRSVFNQISEKKRHKFILKSTKKWEEFLQAHPSIVEDQIPTLHLLLPKLDDIHYYFSTLGLPSRPPISANFLFSNERQPNSPLQNWADLSQSSKDEYIKRLSKMKNEYRVNFLEFVEKTLPSDYIRLEFFRNVKLAAKDYDSFTKDRVQERDEGQSKITQYLTPKNKTPQNDVNEFDRIKQQLLATQLNSEQKKLVERLGQVMNKYIEETKKESSNSKPGAINSTSSKRKSTDTSDVVTVNGDVSSDNTEHSHKKKKKKHKHERSDDEDKKEKSSTTKKRK